MNPETCSSSLVHQALLHSGTEEFLASAVPFLWSGVHGQGRAVLAVVTSSRTDLLRAALGDDAEHVRIMNAETFYQHPVRALSYYAGLVREHAPRHLTVLAEPPTTAATPALRKEWARYEALVNSAFDTSQARVICAYEHGRTDPRLLDAVRRTHPVIIENDHHGQDERARSFDPDQFYGDDPPAPTRDAAAATLTIDSMDQLADLRAFVMTHATAVGVPGQYYLVTAANTVATNALTHGAPPVDARVWTDDHDVVCEITDHGHWEPDPLIGYLPPDPGKSFGLWGVRVMVDTVEIHTVLRPEGSGTQVRLRVHRTDIDGSNR